jgi:hypothetical protein
MRKGGMGGSFLRAALQFEEREQLFHFIVRGRFADTL